MKLYIGEQMVLPVLGSVMLRKQRTEAAATLTASLYAAAADSYFFDLSIALGDCVRLLDDEGKEVFLGSIHELRRTPEEVRITAYDQGIFLTRNELRGIFFGSPAQIAEQVAAKLSIPLGTVEAPGGWTRIVTRAGESAFSILRRALGEGREISIQDGTLCITKSAYMVYALEPSQVLEAAGTASIKDMVNRCEVVDRKGSLLDAAENREETIRYGRMQAIYSDNTGNPAAQAQAALRGRTLTGTVIVLGNPAYLCGCAVELHCPEWGLDGVYSVTAAAHRWEQGQYTTTMELEFVRA